MCTEHVLTYKMLISFFKKGIFLGLKNCGTLFVGLIWEDHLSNSNCRVRIAKIFPP